MAYLVFYASVCYQTRSNVFGGSTEVGQMLNRHGWEEMEIHVPGRKKRDSIEATATAAVTATATATATSTCWDKSMKTEAGQEGRGPNPWAMSMLSMPAVLTLSLFDRKGAGGGLLLLVALRLVLRRPSTRLRLWKVRRTLANIKAAAMLAFMAGVLALPTAGAGRCAFTQVRMPPGTDFPSAQLQRTSLESGRVSVLGITNYDFRQCEAPHIDYHSPSRTELGQSRRCNPFWYARANCVRCNFRPDYVFLICCHQRLRRRQLRF